MSADYPSPNHGDRRGQRPELVVLHYTGMSDTAEARARLCDPTAEVSAHWLIHEDGRVEALVPEDRRAWHAGAGSWKGRDDVNSRSIGIEIANPGDRPFPARQMDAVVVLLREIMVRWHIGPHAVIGHSDMAPDRKIDPGPRFDWQRLAREGLATPSGRAEDLPLEASLTRLGYPPASAELRLSAFRLRHRPWGRGAETEADRRAAAFAAGQADQPAGDGAAETLRPETAPAPFRTA
ncbi:N-acetylmuramoyl-L-alanine amidase [Paracoccus fontiphilus]|uniref:N-acetylmuramoyl-L-alanine amidase n=1 Tax=Paracoccus fontiphilus TaxID=1815556 RepID=A0ABV7IL68_9RHOB